MAEQLPLLRSARLPFAVRRRSVQCAARRVFVRMVKGLAAEGAPIPAGFAVRALAEDQALLSELRGRCRVAARQFSGRPAARAAAFASSPAGRRVYRKMAELSERIAVTEELALCG